MNERGGRFPKSITANTDTTNHEMCIRDRFYHEDFEEYPGAWFSCPVDFEEVKERLGVQSEDCLLYTSGVVHLIQTESQL